MNICLYSPALWPLRYDQPRESELPPAWSASHENSWSGRCAADTSHHERKFTSLQIKRRRFKKIQKDIDGLGMNQCHYKCVCMCVCQCVSYWARRQQISQKTKSLHQHVCVRVWQQAEQLFCPQTLNNLPLHLLISLKCQVLNTIMLKVRALG